VPVERTEEVERKACGVDVGDKKRLVVFLSSKDVLILQSVQPSPMMEEMRCKEAKKIRRREKGEEKKGNEAKVSKEESRMACRLLVCWLR
jgi:hypothetical protein